MGIRMKGETAEGAMLALGLLLLGGFMGWHLYSDHQQIGIRERQRLADLAKVIDDNLGRQLDAVNNALASLQDDLAHARGGKAGGDLLDLRLRTMSSSMPGVRTMAVLDAGGRVVASNRAALLGQDMQGRAYFQLARRRNDPAVLQVSPPIRNYLGTYAINLERSLSGRGGAFAGLVMATLDPDYFTTLLNSVNYAPDMWTALVHEDGTLFTIAPEPKFQPARDLAQPGSMFRRHMASGQTASVLTGRRLATGEWRIIAMRTVRPAGLATDAALVVSVSRNASAIYDHWRYDLWRQGGLYFLLALTAGGGWLLRETRQRRFRLAAARQEALVRSGEEKMRLFFDRQLVGMAITSPAKGWLQVNDRLCAMFGYTREELGTMTWAELTHPHDLASEQALYERMRAGELDQYSTEKRYIRKDGTVLCAELSVGCVRRPDRSLDYVLVLVADITARRRDEESLRRLVREQEIILENANVGISLMVGRRQVWVNRWMEEIFQYPKEEMEGRTTRMLYPDQETYDALGRAAYPVLARGGSYETVQELVRKDGQRLWIHYNGKVVEPSDPDRGTLWILSDVTASKATGDALRESEARFRSMFEAHTAVMLLVDPEDGRIVDGNPAAVRFYGYSGEQLKALNIREINTGSGEEVRNGFESAARGESNWFLFNHRMAGGAVRTVEVMSSPVEFGGRRVLFSIVMDVTERVRFEKELALRQRELEELNQTLEARVAEAVAKLREQDQILMTQSRQAAMGEMLGNIAHQWRQPLNALSMVLINLKDARQCGELDQETFDAGLAKGSDLIQRMSSTINDFRDFFRPDKRNVRFSALDQVRAAVNLLDAAFAARGIAIEVAAADLPVYGLPNEFSQVLVNLLGNAKQAIQDSGREDGRIVISLGEEAGCGWVRITDNGGGVPEHCLDRIFDPYFSTRPSGTGIGLYMSRQIVEQSLEGRILVRNTGDGAEFTVFLPLAGELP